MPDDAFQRFLKLVEPFTGPLDLSEEARQRQIAEMEAWRRDRRKTHPPEFAHEHPAADEAYEIFGRFDVRSEEDYRQLPRRDRYVWDVCWFDTEVMNGGVDQFLYNAIGGHAQETLEAPAAIGARRTYELLKAACDLFPDGRPSPNHEERRRQLAAHWKNDKKIDDLIQGDIEIELFQRLIEFWRAADPRER